MAAIAAADAANVSESADVGANVDAAKCDGKNFDPAAVAPFSTQHSKYFVYYFGAFHLE